MIRAFLNWLFPPAPPLTLRDIDPVVRRIERERAEATERRDMRAVHRANARLKRHVHALLAGKA